MMIDLKAIPFNLDAEQEMWVKSTLESMSIKEKVGQLFCVLGMFTGNKTIKHLTKDIEIGGIMFRPQKAVKLQETFRKLQSNSTIPLLCAANLESGGSGATSDGTNYAMPMGVAATGDLQRAYQMGKIACAEGAAVGCNWAFAPIVDIDMEFHNPITNLRTFGSKTETVIEMSSQYLRAANEEGVAVSIKHFPGDGVDERDQHLVTSVNSLDVEEWDESFGRVYKTLIEQGAQTVMAGHISQPKWVKKINPAATLEECYCPASLSSELLNGLLRKELGFNGLVISDASTMVGFTVAMPREKAVPLCIANGCDMLLFNRDLDEDYEYMLRGVEDGVITKQRLDEAVMRILATKASLGLPEKHKAGTIVPLTEKATEVVGCEKHKNWAKECAEKSITLVKDTQKLLPLNVKKTPRICLNVIENIPRKNSKFAKEIKSRLEQEGFDVVLRNRTLNLDFELLSKGIITPGTIKIVREITSGIEKFKAKYDLVIIVANLQTQSNASVVRLNWKVIMGLGDDAPWFTSEVPTLFVSTANPYHLLDVPMMKTFINAYTATPQTLDALFDKLMGRAEFEGISPVDAFCNRDDTKL